MFYKPYVDIASVKSMWNFLHDHFTYPTLNSWNGLTSVAHNVKLYNLRLDGDWGTAIQYLHDELDVGGLQMCINEEIQEFERSYPRYRVGFNGRSGGYIVLYNHDNYRSVLPDCVTEYDSYENFRQDCKQLKCRVTDFLQELRDAVEIVREFDKLCDKLRDIVNEYSKRSFTRDRLEMALEQFNELYADELDELGLVGPTLDGDKVVLNCLAHYQAFLHCFLNCLSKDRKNVFYNDSGEYLWLAED